MLKLSICVPTYNRAKFLEEQLNDLGQQITSGHLTAEIEIVISDNGSTDATPEVCQRFRENYSDLNVIIHRFEKTTGPDNIYYSTTLTSGEYIWVISDDDPLKPDGIRTLYINLSSNTDCFILTHTYINEDGSVDDRIEPDMDCWGQPDFENVLVELGSWLTYISVICFRRSLLVSYDGKSGGGTGIQLSYAFVDALINARTIAYIPTPVNVYRRGNAGGYNLFKVFIIYFDDLARYALGKGLSEDGYRQFTHRHFLKYILPNIIGQRTVDKFALDIPEIRKLVVKYYRHEPLAWLFALPSLYLPASLLKALYRVREGARTIRNRARN